MLDKRCLLLLACIALAWVHDGGTLAAPGTGRGVAREGRFDALTYNVAGLPEGLSASHPARNSARISPRLNGYDLVWLQEDFCFHREVTGQADHPFRSAPQLAWTTLVNDGLTQLSRFPLARFQRVRWPVASGVVGHYHDCWAAKGFSVATAELAPGVLLDVYNLHGDAGADAADQHARRVSYALLADHLERRSAGRALIVAGDFNLDLGDPVDLALLDELLARTGLRDVGLELRGREPALDRFLFRSSPDLELVPVLLRRAAEFTTEDGAPLSDHPAMHTRWLWRERAVPAPSAAAAAEPAAVRAPTSPARRAGATSPGGES